MTPSMDERYVGIPQSSRLRDVDLGRPDVGERIANARPAALLRAEQRVAELTEIVERLTDIGCATVEDCTYWADSTNVFLCRAHEAAATVLGTHKSFRAALSRREETTDGG